MVAVRRISLPSRLREGWGGACFLRRSATCPPLAPPASGRGTGQVQKRGAKHRRRFGSHGIGRNPVLFIEQLVGDEAEFDRKPQPRPQGFAADAGKIWKARVRQPVGDLPVRFEPAMAEWRGGAARQSVGEGKGGA